MKARWVQIANTANITTNAYAVQIGGSGNRWAAADEDDEIIAYVVESGGGPLWHAETTTGNAPKRGTFLTEDAAKQKVQKWMQPAYDFNVANTTWAYKTNP